jgi:predicted transcriptional regulator of viral defense system
MDSNDKMAYNSMHEILASLAAHNKRVFSINDAAKAMRKPKHYASKLLSSNKEVERIERGKYCIKSGNTDMYEIASQIVFPSYVSGFAALRYYSLVEQEVVKYTVITIKRHKQIKVAGVSIEFVTLPKSRFFGYRRNGGAYIATVEKAIVDSLYMRSPPYAYVSEALRKALRNGVLNAKALKDFALKMESKKVVIQVESLLGAEKVDLQKTLARQIK